MAGNDVILWSVPSDSDPDDVRLRDPSSTSGGGTSYTLTGLAGSYSLSGGNAVLVAARAITANAGSYSISGGTAVLKFGHVLTGNAGSYSLSGGSAVLTVQRKITANAGSYAVTGGSASLVTARALTGNAGTYSITGESAVLTKTAAGGISYTLQADAGSYLITGSDANMVLFTPSYGWVDRHDPGPKKKKKKIKRDTLRETIEEQFAQDAPEIQETRALISRMSLPNIEHDINILSAKIDQAIDEDDEEAILMCL